ncbi:uncharacterized protein LOC129746844 [Uranotaenia lowii]|uniref:uncharacterized protein LOC129746844 n=1 Tax=Uranotaenia lowii TaxID=190385 RepID=UPI00247939B4|nr:uncharacterized protein LOC129746844 [Uranotaenia lowii]
MLQFLLVALAVLLTANAEMSINVQTPNAQMYHQQSNKQNTFTYGYHTVGQQFQHKVKGPDDVTYGCYGYVDPSFKKHLVYYVADRMGYRIIFPNRATKIFTARVSDSLNKLDGSLQGKELDEKVVAWNDLYLPDECFRLDEILSGSASTISEQTYTTPKSTSHVHHQQRPTASSSYGIGQQPYRPQPSQYDIPSTTPRSLPPSNSRPIGSGTYPNGYGQPNQPYHGGQQPISHEPSNNDDYDYNSLGNNQQQVQPTWTGSIPDINPANINLDNYDIDIRFGEKQGSASTVNPQLSPLDQNRWNLTQLLAKIEAVNAQVITFNVLLTGLARNPVAFANANGNTCQQMIQLLRNQNTTPQLVYVPILIPYVEGRDNLNQPFAVPSDNPYQPPVQQQQQQQQQQQPQYQNRHSVKG